VFRPNAWRFRDYVINAFNNDTPWAEFIRQQLAADVFYPDQSNLISALGYLGAGPFDSSTAGTAPITFDYMDRDDQVTQVMAAFVSTTANCARCHAHKFDPITQEDYYALQAVFAGVGKGDREYDADPETLRLRRHWQHLLSAANSNNAEVLLAPEQAPLVVAWEQERKGAEVQWVDLPIDLFLSSDGADLERLDDGSIRAGGTRPDVDTYTLTTVPKPGSITAVRVDVLADETLPMQGPGRQDNGNLHLSEVEIQLFRPNSNTPERLAIAQATADFNQTGWTISHALDKDLKTAWGIYPEVGKSHYAVFELAETVEITPGSQLVVMLKQLHGGGHLIGRCKLSATSAPPAQAAAVPASVTQALAIPGPERSTEQQLAIAAHAIKLRATAELARLPAPVQVYAASPFFNRGAKQDAPRGIKEVQLLTRGDINRPAGLVTPGALSAIAALPARFQLSEGHDESQRRVALAEWIAHHDNPLTWRSIANRVWQFHFGEGICDTPSDFGRMGGVPSHPELLDWLACELRDGDGSTPAGSLKHLHRLILTSQTYQQSSASRPDAEAMDGDNRLLWRANRQRLDAESFYDSVLKVSGRLDLTMGGPGIEHFTTSPGQQTTPKVHYDQYDWARPDAARRAIYRVVWRGIPEPLFESLDFPDLGLLAPDRSNSISALQSLTLWNHPFVLHHSNVTAEQIAEQFSPPAEQAKELYRRMFQRQPTDEERSALEEYIINHGLAAAVRVLLNSNEFLFIN
ncbi:MAG: DUF1553 domain-containing protein, partial [Planctomycetaceae bacterium]|nr:DUF1553 domain-containing protein [Planctomycetaceae bacterium]